MTRLSPRDLILAPQMTPAAVEEALRPYGFADPEKVDRALQTMAGEPPVRELFADIVERLLASVSQSANPDACLNHLEWFARSVFDIRILYQLLRDVPALVELLTVPLGASRYFAETLIRNPGYFEWLMEPGVLSAKRVQDELLDELRRDVAYPHTAEQKWGAMRRFRNREALRIGVRDLLGIAPVEDVTAELAMLADVSLQVAYEIGEKELAEKYGVPQYGLHSGETRKSEFCVIAMGKHGGQELNFSSDIDIMLVYSHEGTTSKGFDNREYFAKLGESIVNALSKVMVDGYVFRVDLRLRPEGASGAIVRSVDSYESHYEAWGEIWEQQAHLKARPAAGDPALGREFLARIRPFVYQRFLTLDDVEAIKTDIRQTKVRIEKRIVPKGPPETHVKLGPGCIRDSEFVVQFLQLVHGSHDPRLQKTNTLDVLDALEEGGYLLGEDVQTLAEGYRFMRRVEHRIQMMDDRQVYHIPQKPEDLSSLARSMGYEDATSFLEAYHRQRERIRRVYDAQLQSAQREDQYNVVLLLDTDDAKEIQVLLQPYGFQDVRAAHRRLKLLAQGSPRVRFTPRTKRLFLRFAPQLMEYLKESPDPDMALNQLEGFITRAGGRPVYYTLFAEAPHVIELFTKLGGTSKFLSEILIQTPELIDMFSRNEWLAQTRSPEDMREEAVFLAEHARGKVFDALRRFKTSETLRIGARDILAGAELTTTTTELTHLAEVVLQQAQHVIRTRLSEEWGEPVDESGSPVPFCVIAMGKLAAEELNYSSDLDLMLVYGSDGETAQGISNTNYFVRVAQDLVSELKAARGVGAIYDVDLRLRPYGNGGPLALSLAGYQDYYQNHAEMWERQALIRARPVAGDMELGEAFMRAAHEFAYSTPLTPDQVAQIVHTRMRKQKKAPVRSRDVKVGYGGIVDIEFAVQTLQLIAGIKHTEVRSPNTLEALSSLTEVGILTTEQREQFQQSYCFLRMVENRLRIVHDRPLNALPTRQSELDKLARRLDYVDQDGTPAAEQFLDDFQRHTKQTRALFDELLDVSAFTVAQI